METMTIKRDATGKVVRLQLSAPFGTDFRVAANGKWLFLWTWCHKPSPAAGQDSHDSSAAAHATSSPMLHVSTDLASIPQRKAAARQAQG